MIQIRISGDALDDLNEGFRFYEAQEPELGEYFLSQLRADIDGLKVTAGIHRQPYRHLHRLLSRRFPYAMPWSAQPTGTQGARRRIRPTRRGLAFEKKAMNGEPTAEPSLPRKRISTDFKIIMLGLLCLAGGVDMSVHQKHQ